MSKMTKAELTEAAEDFAKASTNAHPFEMMADSAAAILEREGVYREICEAADYLKFENGDVIVRSDPEPYFAIRGNTSRYFSTFEEAYAWVK